MFFLSGGLDSSIITTVAQKKHQEKLNSLSIYFEDEQYSEKYYQDLVIQKTGVIHKSYKVTNEEYQAELPNILQAMDQPSIDGVNTYFISKYAKEANLKVVLSGLGADELFGGYSTFDNKVERLRKLKIAASLVSAIYGKYPLKKVGYLNQKRWYNSYLLNRGLFNPVDTAKITGYSINRVNDVLSSYAEPIIHEKLGKQNKVSFLETSIYMQNQLLRDSDVYSMWHGVELRVPFLDKNVIQLARSIDPAIKYNPKQKKFLMVEAFKNYLPEEVWNRSKKGFEFPFESWFKKNVFLSNQNYVPLKWHKKFKSKKINYSRVWAIFLQRTFNQNKYQDIEYSKAEPRLLFLYLSAFSSTGGIEKVNRVVLKKISQSLNEINSAQAISLHDAYIDSRYFPSFLFSGYNGNKINFIKFFWFCKIPWNHIIIGHVNLLPIALILKLRKPKLKFTILAHGIEIWEPLSFFLKKILLKVDYVIAVSEYTKMKLIEINGVKPEKIKVKKNCLDPFFQFKDIESKPKYLFNRYQINPNNPVLLSVCRMSKNDRYKGYLNVLKSISIIKHILPSITYILAGSIEDDEKHLIHDLIDKLGISQNVLLIGYIDDDELIDHYKLANIFVMPSKREGFGIVFIEAAANGLNVIAGNEDASKEALLNGQLGVLVDPDNIEEIAKTILDTLTNPNHNTTRQNIVKDLYSFSSYSNDFLLIDTCLK